MQPLHLMPLLRSGLAPAEFIGGASASKGDGLPSLNLAGTLPAAAKVGDTFVGLYGTIPPGPVLTAPGALTAFDVDGTATGVLFVGQLAAGHLSDFTVGGTTQSCPVAYGLWRGVNSAAVMGVNFSGNTTSNAPFVKTEQGIGAVALAYLVAPAGDLAVDGGWTERVGQQFGNWDHRIWDKLDLSDYAAAQVNFSQNAGAGTAWAQAVVELRR